MAQWETSKIVRAQRKTLKLYKEETLHITQLQM